jgi:hypothetical protein
LSFLHVAGGREPDRSLAAWAHYLVALLRGAELAVMLADDGLRGRAQRDLVWFLRSTPPGAAVLDRHANLAIEEIHTAGPAAAARLRELAVAMGALARIVPDEAQRGAP